MALFQPEDKVLVNGKHAEVKTLKDIGGGLNREMNMDSKDAHVVFEGTKIRRTWHDEQWYFSVVDVVGALTDSSIPRSYWSDLKSNLSEKGFEPYDKIVQLTLQAEDGKMRLTDCANTESMFRIIQSIPSPKAEPFKRWLAKVGYERVQEIEDPELAQKRMKEIYKLKGYSDDWIEKRVRGIAIRDELTDEWGKRSIKTNSEYSILTAEFSKAAFGLTPAEYKKVKGLKHQNLRDHMNDLELIFTMLGEASKERITNEEARVICGVNRYQAKRLIRKLISEKSLKQQGKGRGTYYEIC